MSGRNLSARAPELPRDPKTAGEWQSAVDSAALMRAIHDCYLYGLLTGPAINVDRCDELIERGRALGYTPRDPLETLKKK